MGGWNLPVISNMARGAEIDNKAIFKTTSRVSESLSGLAHGIVSFLEFATLFSKQRIFHPIPIAIQVSQLVAHRGPG